MLPHFIIGGIQKCGTTYLDSLVRSHPEIHILERNYKEHSFFDDDNIFQRGVGWYERLFEGVPDDKVIGQTSADCAYNPLSAKRISELLPAAKMIFILRHPVDRAYSLYWHQIRMGREILTFEQAIAKETRRTERNGYRNKKFAYLGRSRYATQFDNVFNFIDRSRVLCIPFELFIKDEVFFLNRIFKFLGVREISGFADLNYRETSTNPARIPSSKVILTASYLLQRAGMVGLGRRLLNSNLVHMRPPMMQEQTREYLEDELGDDIAFYKSVVSEFLNRD